MRLMLFVTLTAVPCAAGSHFSDAQSKAELVEWSAVAMGSELRITTWTDEAHTRAAFEAALREFDRP